MLAPEQHRLQGQYEYELDNQPVAITETFTVHRTEEGDHRIRGRRVAPGGSSTLSVEGLVDRTGVQDLEVTFSGKGLVQTRRYQRDDRRYLVDGDVVEAAPGAHLFGLLRVFTGPLLLAQLAEGGTGQVISPSLDTADGGEQLLLPGVSERRVRETDELLTGHFGAPSNARCVEWKGGPYRIPCRCWIDPNGLLKGYDWLQPGTGNWRVRLRA